MHLHNPIGCAAPLKKPSQQNTHPIGGHKGEETEECLAIEF